MCLNYISKVKCILKEINLLKCYGLNHDFISNKDLIDININKSALSYLNDESLIEEEEDDDYILEILNKRLQIQKII